MLTTTWTRCARFFASWRTTCWCRQSHTPRRRRTRFKQLHPEPWARQLGPVDTIPGRTRGPVIIITIQQWYLNNYINDKLFWDFVATVHDFYYQRQECTTHSLVAMCSPQKVFIWFTLPKFYVLVDRAPCPPWNWSTPDLRKKWEGEGKIHWLC